MVKEMRSSKSIHIISAHAEGEVGDVIVGVFCLLPEKQFGRKAGL